MLERMIRSDLPTEANFDHSFHRALSRRPSLWTVATSLVVVIPALALLAVDVSLTSEATAR